MNSQENNDIITCNIPNTSVLNNTNTNIQTKKSLPLNGSIPSRASKRLKSSNYSSKTDPFYAYNSLVPTISNTKKSSTNSKLKHASDIEFNHKNSLDKVSINQRDNNITPSDPEKNTDKKIDIIIENTTTTETTTNINLINPENSLNNTESNNIKEEDIATESNTTKTQNEQNPPDTTDPLKNKAPTSPSNKRQDNSFDFKLLYPDDSRDKVFVAILQALLLVGNKPCSPKELAKLIMDNDLTVLGGATPYATVSSRISQHFKRVSTEPSSSNREPILGRVANSDNSRKILYCLIPQNKSNSLFSKSLSTSNGDTPNSKNIITSKPFNKKKKFQIKPGLNATKINSNENSFGLYNSTGNKMVKKTNFEKYKRGKPTTLNRTNPQSRLPTNNKNDFHSNTDVEIPSINNFRQLHTEANYDSSDVGNHSYDTSDDNFEDNEINLSFNKNLAPCVYPLESPKNSLKLKLRIKNYSNSLEDEYTHYGGPIYERVNDAEISNSDICEISDYDCENHTSIDEMINSDLTLPCSLRNLGSISKVSNTITSNRSFILNKASLNTNCIKDIFNFPEFSDLIHKTSNEFEESCANNDPTYNDKNMFENKQTIVTTDNNIIPSQIEAINKSTDSSYSNNEDTIKKEIINDTFSNHIQSKDESLYRDDILDVINNDQSEDYIFDKPDFLESDYIFEDFSFSQSSEQELSNLENCPKFGRGKWVPKQSENSPIHDSYSSHINGLSPKANSYGYDPETNEGNTSSISDIRLSTETEIKDTLPNSGNLSDENQTNNIIDTKNPINLPKDHLEFSINTKIIPNKISNTRTLSPKAVSADIYTSKSLTSNKIDQNTLETLIISQSEESSAANSYNGNEMDIDYFYPTMGVKKCVTNYPSTSPNISIDNEPTLNNHKKNKFQQIPRSKTNYEKSEISDSKPYSNKRKMSLPNTFLHKSDSENIATSDLFEPGLMSLSELELLMNDGSFKLKESFEFLDAVNEVSAQVESQINKKVTFQSEKNDNDFDKIESPVSNQKKSNIFEKTSVNFDNSLVLDGKCDKEHISLDKDIETSSNSSPILLDDVNISSSNKETKLTIPSTNINSSKPESIPRVSSLEGGEMCIDKEEGSPSDTENKTSHTSSKLENIIRDFSDTKIKNLKTTEDANTEKQKPILYDTKNIEQNLIENDINSQETLNTNSEPTTNEPIVGTFNEFNNVIIPMSPSVVPALTPINPSTVLTVVETVPVYMTFISRNIPCHEPVPPKQSNDGSDTLLSKSAYLADLNNTPNGCVSASINGSKNKFNLKHNGHETEAHCNQLNKLKPECKTKTFKLLRLAENGYVNASTLLEAGGVNSEQERNIVLSLEVGRFKWRRPDSQLSGTWVPLSRARALAATCSLTNRLGVFLNDNLESYFPSPLPTSFIKSVIMPCLIPALMFPFPRPQFLGRNGKSNTSSTKSSVFGADMIGGFNSSNLESAFQRAKLTSLQALKRHASFNPEFFLKRSSFLAPYNNAKKIKLMPTLGTFSLDDNIKSFDSDGLVARAANLPNKNKILRTLNVHRNLNILRASQSRDILAKGKSNIELFKSIGNYQFFSNENYELVIKPETNQADNTMMDFDNTTMSSISNDNFTNANSVETLDFSKYNKNYEIADNFLLALNTSEKLFGNTTKKDEQNETLQLDIDSEEKSCDKPLGKASEEKVVEDSILLEPGNIRSKENNEIDSLEGTVSKKDLMDQISKLSTKLLQHAKESGKFSVPKDMDIKSFALLNKNYLNEIHNSNISSSEKDKKSGVFLLGDKKKTLESYINGIASTFFHKQPNEILIENQNLELKEISNVNNSKEMLEPNSNEISIQKSNTDESASNPDNKENINDGKINTHRDEILAKSPKILLKSIRIRVPDDASEISTQSINKNDGKNFQITKYSKNFLRKATSKDIYSLNPNLVNEVSFLEMLPVCSKHENRKQAQLLSYRKLVNNLYNSGSSLNRMYPVIDRCTRENDEIHSTIHQREKFDKYEDRQFHFLVSNYLSTINILSCGSKSPDKSTLTGKQIEATNAELKTKRGLDVKMIKHFAQLAERLPRKQKVAGSIPVGGIHSGCSSLKLDQYRVYLA
ncbi:hypothetical protein BB559_002217 [Furculomyces boomerangus]|uniref:HTH APSES-type domain-containing protein n=1 Tax=Furculomyces boomerangus TaxID=61424 RepID=A0A2T9YX55_9FUNG|nr:hypothetical protein BB559_002217 [Furculomyces boomerangus]